MFEKKDIDLAIAGTLNDLEGFIHPLIGRLEKGTDIGPITTNMIYFASGQLVGGGLSTKPEQYDSIVQVFADRCIPEQQEKIRGIINRIIDENHENKTREHEKPGRGFTYCAYNGSEGWGSVSVWGSAMRALCKHFGVEFPTQ